MLSTGNELVAAGATGCGPGLDPLFEQLLLALGA